jgi:mannose/fructose/N-acetylgalactosamine-specific phosphotransferase system component IID
MCERNIIKTTTKAVSLSILISLIGFMVSVTVSLHIHVLPDGRIIAHSHTTERTDSGGSGGNNHSHTGKEFTLVHSLTNILDKLTFAIIPALLFTAAIILVINIFHTIRYLSRYHSIYPNRAPPPISC